MLSYHQEQACPESARGDSLFDMPNGDGTLSAMLASKFKWAIRTDASGKYLALGEVTIPNAALHEALIEDLATTECFNTIKTSKVLEHVVDAVQVLRRAARLLIEESVMLVQVSNAKRSIVV